MTTPTELSEAHLQDHELMSAALEASSTSPEPTSSALPTFLTLATEQFPKEMSDTQEPLEVPQTSSRSSPDLSSTPRTDSSRPLSSPPQLDNLSATAVDNPPASSQVGFTLLKRDGPSSGGKGEVRQESADHEREERIVDLEERFREASVRDGANHEHTGSSDVDGVSSLDPVLLAALSHHRDRFLLLRAEVELERFLANPSMTRLPLAPPYFQPALNSYQRLLVHRLADTFGITREVEAAPPTIWNAGGINPATGQPQGVVVLVKGENTRLPPAKLATYAPAPEAPTPIVPSSIAAPPPSSTPSAASSPIPSGGPSNSTPSLSNLVDSSSAQSQQPTAPQILKILPRSSASRTASSASSSIGTDDDPNSSSSAAASSRGKGRKELTLEEREAAYREARERIFSQPEQERNATALPSSSSAASEDISARMVLAGSGITRPSSAGSTFSRSSAALSVAGGRPSPSVASESGSSMWSGHHGGMYGGGSQLTPSLRHSSASFDPNGSGPTGWIPEHANQYYSQFDPSWQQNHPQQFQQQQQQYQPHFSRPPIQITAPAAQPPYSASPSHSAMTNSVPPLASQPHFAQVDAWGRNVSNIQQVPSPSLPNPSGHVSVPRPHGLQHYASSSSSATTSDRSISGNSGYLMRFADTGALVNSGGTVSTESGPPPSQSFSSPSSSVFVGPPSASRSVSSFSSTSQQSLSSGSNTSRTSPNSNAEGGPSVSGGNSAGNATINRSDARRPSGLLAGSVLSARSSGERAGEPDGVGGTPVELKKRDRQTTIRRQSPSSTEAEQRTANKKKVEISDDSSSLHPSLPPKPVWAATKPPRPRTPPAQNTSPSNDHSAIASTGTRVAANGPRSLQAEDPPYPMSMQHGQPSLYDQGFSAPAPPLQLLAPQYHAQNQGSSWSRTPSIHYPAVPSFVPTHLAGSSPHRHHPGRGVYPPGNPQVPMTTWNYAHPMVPPVGHVPAATAFSQPSQPLHLSSSRGPGADASGTMPFTDIRRPPPKSTHLFDPNRPNRGSGGTSSSSGMRRGVSGAGSIRSIE